MSRRSTPSSRAGRSMQLIQPSVAALYKIGAAHLKYETDSPASPERARRVHRCADRAAAQAGLFVTDIGKVTFLGERLFRATLSFPAERADRNLSRSGIPDPRRRRGQRADDTACRLEGRSRRRDIRIRDPRVGGLWRHCDCRRAGGRMACQPGVSQSVTSQRGPACPTARHRVSFSSSWTRPRSIASRCGMPPDAPRIPAAASRCCT